MSSIDNVNDQLKRLRDDIVNLSFKMHTGGFKPLIQDITLSNNTFVGGSPNGTTVGTITVVMAAGGTFTGTLGLTGTDANKFTIVAGVLKTVGTLTTGTYDINIVATQPSARQSPFPKNFPITGTSAAQAFSSVGIDNFTFTPNGINDVNVGNVVVVMNPTTPASTAVITLTGTDSGNFLLTNGGNLPCILQAKANTGVGTYTHVALIATQPGISNSPFTTNEFTITGSSSTSSITTLAVVSNSGTLTDTIVEFALPLPPATHDSSKLIQVLDSDQTVLTAQEDLRSTDADSGIRFAKIAVRVPTITTTTKFLTIKAISGTRPNRSPITVADILATDYEEAITLTMPDGTVYTTSARTALAGSSTFSTTGSVLHGTYRDGTGGIVTEYLASAPLKTGGTPHAQLRAWFHISASKLGTAAVSGGNPIVNIRTDIIIENGYKGGVMDDQIYDFLVQEGVATPTTKFQLNGAAGDTGLTLSAVSGSYNNPDHITITRDSGNWSLSNTPNSSDNGKAIVEIGGTGRAWLTGTTGSSTVMFAAVASDKAFSDVRRLSGQWKKMGVYHTSRCRFVAPRLWWGTQPNYLSYLSTSYLKSSQMFLNYAADFTSAAVDLGYITTLEGDHPMAVDGLNQTSRGFIWNEGGTGDVASIGVVPYQQTIALLNWDHDPANAQFSMVGQAHACNMIPRWIRDEEDGGLLSVSSCGVWGDGRSGQPNNQVLASYGGTSGFFRWATNHAGDAATAAYLTTGDLKWLEGCMMQATHQTVITTDFAYLTSFQGFLTGTPYRWTCTGHPFATGDCIIMDVGGGYFPQISGVNIPRANFYYLNVVDANTVDTYDTRAHALAGGATGRVSFSSGGSGPIFTNGKTKSPAAEGASNANPRQIAWAMRTWGHTKVCMPDSLPANIVGPCNKKSDFQKAYDFQLKYVTRPYVTSGNYTSFGPRFFGQQNGNSYLGQWQMDYNRLSSLNLLEQGAQSTVASDLKDLVDWLAHDPIARLTRSDAGALTFMVGDYYSRNCHWNGSTLTPVYDWPSYYTEMMKGFTATPASAAFWTPPGFTVDVGSVSNQAAVPLVLKAGGVEATYFDMTSTTTRDRSIGTWVTAGSGVGQITSISSKGTCVVDCTVAIWDGAGDNNGHFQGRNMTSGNGQAMAIGYPSLGNGDAVHGFPIAFPNDGTYFALAHMAVQIAKQRGINTANYAAAENWFTTQVNFPAWNPPTPFWATTVPSFIKASVKSRI